MTTVFTINNRQCCKGPFETYLMTGKAPSLSLRRTFASFSRWLTRIYRTLADDRLKRANLTPEITEIFDRLLATEVEIEAAKAGPMYEQFFRSQEQAGMTDAEWKKYTEQVQKANDTTEATVQEKVLKEWRDRKSKEWKAEKAPIIEEEKARLSKEPVYEIQAQNKKEPMDYDLLVSANDGKLPGKFIGAKKGGINPEEYASIYGFNSVRSMINAVQAAPALSKAADEAAEARMIAKHGDILNDGTIEAEIDEAAHNEEQAKVLLMELRQLKKRAGAKDIHRDYLKAEARRVIHGMTYRQIQPGKYYRSEIRAAKKAANAETEAEVLEAKIQQLTNHYYYKEAVEAKRAFESKRKRLRGMKTRKYSEKKVHPDYIRNLQLFLASRDFRVQSKQTLDDLLKVARWVKGQYNPEQGLELELHDSVLIELMEAYDSDTLDQVKLTPWQDMTLNELSSIHDMAEHLLFIGKQLSEEEHQKQRIINEKLADHIVKKNPVKGKRPKNKTLRRKTQDLSKGYGAQIFLHADSVLRRLDGYVDDGLAYTLLKRPIDDAVTQKLLPMQEKAGEDMDALYSAQYTKPEIRAMNKPYYIKGADMELTRWEAIAIALNWGNASSREAVLASKTENQLMFTQAGVDAILDTLDKRDWDFVQSVWDYIESYRKDLFELQRRRKGSAPPIVEASPVETKFGVYKGGYYPLKYDAKQSTRVSEEDANQMMEQVTLGRFTKAATKDGMMQARVGSGGRPISLDTMVFHRHINEVLQMLALAEPVEQVRKILASSEIRVAMEQTRNEEYLAALDVWLKDAAAGEIISGDAVTNVLRGIRSGFSSAKIGWNVGTMLMQPLGLAQTMPVVGYGNTLKALGRVLVNPVSREGLFARAQKMSPFMKERGTTFNKDIRDTLEYLHGDPSKPAWIPEGFRKSLFAGIVWTQKFVDTTTWWAQYEKAKNEKGPSATEEDLIHSADRAVARSQASGIWSDRTPIERGTTSISMRQSEWIRMFTALGSYFFAKGNVVAELTGKTNFRNPVELGKYVVDLLMLFTVEAVIVGLLRGTWPDDDDDESVPAWIAKESAYSAIGSFPLIREIGSEVSGFKGSSTLGQFYKEISDLVKQVGQGELDMAAIKALNDVGGIAFKYPSGAINRAGQSLVDQIQGEDVAPIDYLIWREKD